jgi:hypothetical protein
MTLTERINRAALEIRLFCAGTSPSDRRVEDVIAETVRAAIAEEREAAARVLDEKARMHDVAATAHSKVLNSAGDASDQTTFADLLRSAAADIRARS